MDRLLRGLLHDAADVPPAESLRTLRELLRQRVTVEGDRQLAEEHPEEPCALRRVGIRNLDTLRESRQHRLIDGVGDVRRGEHEDMALALLDAVHLLQQLVDDLPGERIGTRTAAHRGDRLDLIDEEDAGRLAAGALEQLPHFLARLPDESRLEIRRARGDERYAALVGQRARDLRLASTRRAIEQRTLRHLEALRGELLDVTQRLTERLQLLERLLRQHERCPACALVDGLALR